MDEPQVLVIGALTVKGIKISSFLKRNGFSVFGVDRFGDETKNQANTFLRIDLKHRESMELLFKLCRPVAVIYCWEGNKEGSFFPDEHYYTYWKILNRAIIENYSKVVLCIETVNGGTPENVSQLAMTMLTSIFSEEYKMQYIILNNQDNLLKEIKDFLKGG